MTIFLPQLRGINIAASVGGGADPATTAWVNAVVAAGGTVSVNQQGYVDTLIKALKADGTWQKLDRLWLYASENAQQAQVDLVANISHTLHSSPIFTANRGYAGDGIAAYIDTGFAPSSNGVNYSQNGACFGLYVRTAESRTASNYYFAATDDNSTHANGLRKNGGGTQYNFAINLSNTNTFVGWNLGTQTGRFHVERTGSSTSSLYQNGTQVQTNGNVPTFSPTAKFFVLAANSGASAPAEFTQAQLGCFYVGAGGIVSSIDLRLAAYFSSVGA
jgi:hypothetical protein